MTKLIRGAMVAVLLSSAFVALTSAINLPNRLRSLPPAPSPRRLTLTDRVAYQYAIEDVYWRHRIWPKENADPKPVLDAVVSQRQLENKVGEYLRRSQLVASERGLPITASELQTEMERMASHTKRPDVLRELFSVLGNDPFIIAECLARPILADRLVNELNVHISGGDGSPSRPLPRADVVAGSEIAPCQTVYKLPEISPLDCVNDSWTPTTTVNAPERRWGHTAVWTGSEVIVWGGYFYDGNDHYLNTGGRYNPSTDSWLATSTVTVPSSRSRHTAVWTGTEMIVWGGYDGTYLNTGERYNPSTDSWTPTSTTNAPTARAYHTAVWAGSEMIAWGGFGGTYLNTGGRYNSSTDSWTPTGTTNAPSPRGGHTAVWIGNEMIAWGGNDNSGVFNSGGRYNPSADSWTATSMVNAPYARSGHTAVWTGSEMIAWGGTSDSTGGRYNPGTDSWTATSTTNAPAARRLHTAVWTGDEMIAWGGFRYPPPIDVDDGGRYNPATDTWMPTSFANVPEGRESHTAVWTGGAMLVWGGVNGNDPAPFLNTGGVYCAQPSAPIVQSAASRKTHGSAGSFDLNLPLSGTPGIECRSGGATNDYTVVVTFLANVSVSGSPQAAVTAGSGTVGSGGVSNGGVVTISGNVVTIPLTNVSNAQTINVTLNSVNGSTNIVIPMSILFGDTNGNSTVNAADVAQTKSRLGQTIDATNFRSDVNANGSINAADTAIIKQNSGTSLPPRSVAEQNVHRTAVDSILAILSLPIPMRLFLHCSLHWRSFLSAFRIM